MASLTVWNFGPYYEISQATLAASPGDTIVVLGGKPGGVPYDPAIVLDENLTINAFEDVGLIQLSMATGIVQLNAKGSSAFFITGNSSNNIISTGDRDDFISGESGNDTLNGGDGDDIAGYILSPAGVNINLATGVGSDGHGGTDTLISIEALIGSQFGDVLTGDSGDNFFLGLHGNDTINGGGGFDTLSYEDVGAGGGGVSVNLATGVASDGLGGVDTVSQIESVIGTEYSDTLTGDASDNTFLGDRGADIISGGGGTDTVTYSSSTSGVTVNLSSGTASDGFGTTDTLSGLERIVGSAHADALTGDGNANWFLGGNGADIINGGGGFDFVSYQVSPAGVVVNLSLGSAQDGYNRTDTLTSIEGVIGSEHADTLTGSSADEAFDGRGGNDIIDGGDGVDTVFYNLDISQYAITYDAASDTYTVAANSGTEGSDTLRNVEFLSFALAGGLVDITTIGGGSSPGSETLVGDDGDNTFDPGDGDDTVDGRGGFDTVTYAASTSGVTVNLATGVVDDGMGGTDTLTSIERIIGSAFADNLTGSVADETFQVTHGGNIIDGAGGLDTLSYAGSSHGVVVNRTEGRVENIDDVFGSNDTISNIESFVGTDHLDRFYDRLGTDHYSGGSGADQLFFDARGGPVVVNASTGQATEAGGAVNTFTGISEVFGTNDLDTISLAGHARGVMIDFFNRSVTDSEGAVISFGSFEIGEGSSFDDTMIGGHADTFVFRGLAGNDTLTGRITSPAIDWASYSLDPQAVVANLATGSAQDGFGGSDTLNYINALEGSNFNDTLIGRSSDNYFRGLGGDDAIDGAGGTDTAVYALSADQYTVTYDAGTGDYTVTALSGDEGTDTLRDIEFLSFSGGATDVAIADAVVQPQLSSDFDGDGDDDVVFSFVSDTNAMINHADGSGGSWIGYAGRTLLDTGDFDGDGDTDLLFQLADGNKLIFNVGQGGTWLGSNDRVAKAVGDFDGDGDDDVVFEFANGDKLIANVGEGNTWLGLNNRSLIATGDFDGDGDDDFLFEFADGNKLISRLGEDNIWVGASDRTAKGVGDFDGDGDDDILFEFANGDKLIFNAGVGNTWLGNSDRSVEAVGDFDGDGDDDILFEFADGNKIIANVGSGSTWLGQTNRSATAVGDFDGDGDDDILMELADGNHLIVHVGAGNQWLGFPDRDAIGSDVTGLGTSIEVA